MPDNPYQSMGNRKITGVRKGNKIVKSYVVLAYVSTILFAVFVFSLMVFPEQLEEIAMAWSMFKDPNQLQTKHLPIELVFLHAYFYYLMVFYALCSPGFLETVASVASWR